MPSGITRKKTGKIVMDTASIAKLVETAAIGHVLSRNNNGLDTDDRPFKPYSAAYLNHLRSIGEDTKVDHRVSGQMLSQVRVLRRQEETQDGAVVRVVLEIGVGSGGNRSIIGAFLQRLRKWLGLSPSGRKSIAALIQKAKKTVVRNENTQQRL